MSAQEKKRRWTEEAEGLITTTPSVSVSVSVPGTPTKPPLKKRFTSINSLSSASCTLMQATFDSKEEEEVEEDYTLMSKETLLECMRSAKKQALEEEENTKILDQKVNEVEVHRSVLCAQWRLMQDELLVLIRSLTTMDAVLPDLPKDLSDASLKDQLQILQQATRLLTERALDHVETWKRSADQMQNQYRTSQDLTEQQMIITEWIKRDTEDLCVSYERIQHVMEELKEQERKREIQTDYIVDNLQSMKKHVEEAIIALEETTVVLVQAEKRYDRSKSTIVASLALGGLGGIREKQSDTTEMSKAKSYSVSKQKETPPETNKPGSIADQAVKQQLAEHQLIIDTRMKELEDLKHERRLLLEDTERLKSQLSALSEERLMETEYYKTLQVATDHYRSRTYYLEQMRTQLERELDTISLERRQLVDHVKAEKQSQSLAMETEMRRLENDLSRIRSQRDHFQLLLNEQTAKEAYEKEASDNVLASVEQQRQHILALQSEMVQARAEEPMAGPLEEELKTYIDLELELESANIMLVVLEQSQNGSLEEEKALKLSTDAMKNEAKEIEQHIQRWKDRSATTDMHRQMYAFMSELEIQKKEKDKLQLIIDFFENNEGQLLKQIDTVAAIYGKLEEQSTKKVLDLSQKKEQKMKLQAEKTKYAQTFPSLKAAKDKHLANVTSLRRTSEQQMEHINQLEEREKTQETQVEEKETEVRLAERTVERYRMEVDELTKKTNEYRISLERSDIQIHELQKILKERTRALDEEKQLKKRVDEDYEKMKRRWDMISHGDNPAEQQLAEECEELRALLKCSACRTRFRTRLLARCMHTFCKECIDTRLETRQRRCPTCSESFGISDVRQFFL